MPKKNTPIKPTNGHTSYALLLEPASVTQAQQSGYESPHPPSPPPRRSCLLAMLTTDHH